MMYLVLFLALFLISLPYLLFPRPPKPQKQQIYAYILILGCPAKEDGTLSPAQRKRIDAAVHYYQEGFSDTIIVSGSAVKNSYLEAEVMIAQLQTLLPKACIHAEGKARNTYQNMQFTKQQFPAEQVLIVSGPSHLRRAYFFARKFYAQASLGCAEFHDPWYFYLWEYTRMWVALYWEVRLLITARKSK